jgi:hypothetical protein
MQTFKFALASRAVWGALLVLLCQIPAVAKFTTGWDIEGVANALSVLGALAGGALALEGRVNATQQLTLSPTVANEANRLVEAGHSPPKALSIAKLTS